MTPREIVLAQLNHEETPVIPYSFSCEQVVADALTEHYGSEEAWRDKLTTYMGHLGGQDTSARTSLDDIRDTDAFGTIWRTDEMPRSVVEPGLQVPSFEGYAFPSADTFMDPAAMADAKTRAGESHDSFTIVSTGLCLWQSWYLRGFENTLMDCVAEEDFYAEMLDRFTDLCLASVQGCADIPADAIMMGDDWGNQRGVMIGPERWRRFLKPRYARIFEAIHDQGKIAIMHCCGSVADIMGDIIEIGLDVLESVQPEAAGMNPYALKQAWGDKITFWGCLGSQYTIPFAAPVEIRQEIRRLRREMGRGGGYILAPAKPLRSETPTENAAAIVKEFLAGSASS